MKIEKMFIICPRCGCKQLGFAILKDNKISLIICTLCSFVLAEVEIKKSGTDCMKLKPFNNDWEMYKRINEFLQEEKIIGNN